MFRKKSWDLEEMKNLTPAIAIHYRDSKENFSKDNEFGKIPKSKSDGDLYISWKSRRIASVRCKDLENFSTSPSDSNVTIIRVLRRSEAHNYSRINRGYESELANSPSMINLVRTVQRCDSSQIINQKQDRLVSLSSWDTNEIPVCTASDSKILASESRAKERGSSLFSFATWNKYCLANADRRIDRTSIDRSESKSQRGSKDILKTVCKPEAFAIETIVEDEDKAPLDKKTRPEDQDLSPPKPSPCKLSTRIQKAFHCIACSCVSGNVEKKAEIKKLK